MCNCKWSKDTPTKEGRYWFYGEIFEPHGRPEPELEVIEVKKTFNSFAFIAHGTFLYPEEGMQGLWMKTDLPDLPTDFKYHWKENYYWCTNKKCERYHKDWTREQLTKINNKHNDRCNYCFNPLELVVDNLSVFPYNEVQKDV